MNCVYFFPTFRQLLLTSIVLQDLIRICVINVIQGVKLIVLCNIVNLMLYFSYRISAFLLTLEQKYIRLKLF